MTSRLLSSQAGITEDTILGTMVGLEGMGMAGAIHIGAMV